MKKLSKKFIATILVFTILCPCFFAGVSVNIYASSVKADRKRACNVYKTWLSKNKSKFNGNGDATRINKEKETKTSDFMLVDLDGNGVPELIACHPMSCRWDDIYVYTYLSKRMVQVKDENGGLLPISANTSANGSHYIYKCKKNHLHIEGHGGWWSYEKIYAIKNGRMKLIAQTQEDSMMSNTIYYERNGKKVSAKKYKVFVKKCNVNGYDSVGHLITNTKANRKKFIK